MNATVIGSGYIAEKHIQILNALNCSITGIYSRNYDRALNRSKLLGIKTVYHNFNNIDDENTDFFIIAVSAENNENVLKEILKFNKPILIEKPASFCSKNLEEIIQNNKKMLSKVMVGVNRRFYSVFHKALSYLAEHDKPLNAIMIEAPERFSDIGLPKFSKFIKDNWMYANSIHCIDLIRFFSGNVESINVHSVPSKYFFSATGHGSKNVEFVYLSNWKSPGNWSVTLYADDVRINFNPLEQGIIIAKNQIKKILPSEQDQRFKPGFHFQMNFFLNNILKNTKISFPASNLSDHLNTLKLIEKIFKLN